MSSLCFSVCSQPAVVLHEDERQKLENWIPVGWIILDAQLLLGQRFDQASRLGLRKP